MTIQQARNKIEQKKGKRDQVEQDIKDKEAQIKQKNKELRDHEKAREIVREVGLKTQKQLEYNISEITSLALEVVLSDPYELKVEFVQRRNKTECDLYFVDKFGNRVEPIYAGGGAMDTASFALRVASWSMQSPRSRNTIILDEPFKFLSVDKQGMASQMLHDLSEKMDLQFIIVTHLSHLTESADKIFHIEQQRGVSQVKTEEK